MVRPKKVSCYSPRCAHGRYVRHWGSLVGHVVEPLLIGGVIYVLWRPVNLRLFRWLEALNIYALVITARRVLPSLPEWATYSLPAGLWMYSVVAALTFIWMPDRRGWWLLWVSLALLLGPGGEVAQLCGLIPGRFDPVDLISYLLTGGLALALTYRKVSHV